MKTIDSDALVTATGGLAFPPGGGSTGPTFPWPRPQPLPNPGPWPRPNPLPFPFPEPGGPINDPVLLANRK